jgi:hypothetical protein
MITTTPINSIIVKPRRPGARDMVMLLRLAGLIARRGREDETPTFIPAPDKKGRSLKTPSGYPSIVTELITFWQEQRASVHRAGTPNPRQEDARAPGLLMCY